MSSSDYKRSSAESAHLIEILHEAAESWRGTDSPMYDLLIQAALRIDALEGNRAHLHARLESETERLGRLEQSFHALSARLERLEGKDVATPMGLFDCKQKESQ